MEATPLQPPNLALAGLHHLHTLQLGWCIGLGDEDLQHLSHLTCLTCLTLSYTKATDEGLRSLLPMARLSHLDLQVSGVCMCSCVCMCVQVRGVCE